MTQHWHLTSAIVDELLERMEKSANDPVMDGSPGTVREVMVPVQYLHPLLVLWKQARNKLS